MNVPVDRSTPHKYSRMTKNDQRKYFYEEKTITGCEQFYFNMQRACLNIFIKIILMIANSFPF